MKAWAVTLLAAFGPACASPVAWGSDLLSVERTTDTAYHLKARMVDGRLNIRRDVSYGLKAQAGQVALGGRALKTGCLIRVALNDATFRTTPDVAPYRTRRIFCLSFQSG